MYRYVEERAQFYTRFETMETSEIVAHMIECGTEDIYNQQMGLGWCNIVVVTGSNLKAESANVYHTG